MISSHERARVCAMYMRGYMTMIDDNWIVMLAQLCNKLLKIPLMLELIPTSFNDLLTISMGDLVYMNF